MIIRDKEIERLTKYAEGLGTKVYFSNNNSDSIAEWQLDGQRITIYTKKHTSKIEIVLSLIHEISHHLTYIRENERKMDEKLDEALGEDKKIYRKRVLDFEEKGLKYWEEVYRDTDCKFPIYRLRLQKEFDIYQYEFYYENGRFPTEGECRIKKKELKNKYKKMNNIL